MWSYTSPPQYIFMAWCLVKPRDNLTFIWGELFRYVIQLLPRWCEGVGVVNEKFYSAKFMSL
jgi:hypothetical protein